MKIFKKLTHYFLDEINEMSSEEMIITIMVIMLGLYMAFIVGR